MFDEDFKLLNIIYHKKQEIYEECLNVLERTQDIKNVIVEKFCYCDVILDEILSEFYDFQAEQERKEV